MYESTLKGIKRVKVPPPLLSYLSAECSRALVVGLKTRGFSYDISESAVLSKMSKYLPVLLRHMYTQSCSNLYHQALALKTPSH